MTTIAVTPGEPAGVGPDITLELAARPSSDRLVAVADMDVLLQRAQLLGLDLCIEAFSASRNKQPATPTLEVLDVKTEAPVQCGKLDPANSPYVLETLALATKHCLRGDFDALVTGPVHKGVINDAGIAFTGHTEFLAQQCAVDTSVMMLATPQLRVALATTHLPLKEVASALNQVDLERTLRILVTDLQERFGLRVPRIVVCGLNPHAGEGGHLGTEERDVIEPVIKKLTAEGLCLVGPVPADTAFTPGVLESTDAVLAMYHDQGLPVLKHAGFGEAVNITLGLPIIRTSVDHGTALDLAGSGKASASSLAAALGMARQLVAHR